MPRSRAVIAKEIQCAHETVQSINLHIRELQEELRKAGPAEPKASRVSVSVWFTARGKRYEFLLVRPPGSSHWHSTGKNETAEFRNWDEVIEWLNGPNVHNYGHMHVLEKGEEIV